MHLVKRWAHFIFCLALSALPVFSQAGNATLSGTVRDQTEAVIPAVTVILTNTATNVSSQTKASDSGFYFFPAVQPGPYQLSVTHSGMQPYQAVLTIQVQQRLVVDPVLTTGATTTAVDVRDHTPVVTSDNPTLGHVLERERIEQLPIFYRGIEQLLITVPGIELFRAYGESWGSLEYVLDGAPVSDRLWGDRPPTSPPGLDSVNEFKVETNGSSAKFNRPVSVIISTRSGTNKLHGSLFETHRNNGIGKARNREDFSNKPPQLIHNEFGASAGGPVVLPKIYNGRNRTFWFFSYEGFRRVSAQTKAISVPTAAMRRGDFSNLVDGQGRGIRIYDPWTTDTTTWARDQISYQGRLNVIDPARISPLAKYVYSVTPLPTDPNVNPLQGSNWFGPAPTFNHNWKSSTRIDQRFSDRDQFNARYTQGSMGSHQHGFGQALVPLDGIANFNDQYGPNKNLALNYVRTISPSFFNELLVTGTTYNIRETTGGDVNYAEQLGLPNPLHAAGFPGLVQSGLNGFMFQANNTRQSWFSFLILDDNATKIRGKHELQFGFHFRYDKLNHLPDQQDTQGFNRWDTNSTALYDVTTPRNNPQVAPLTGFGVANQFLGLMQYSNQFTHAKIQARGREYALYLQDNYKVSRRLTLNLGLRWELWPPYKEINDTGIAFDRDTREIVLGRDLDTMYRMGTTLPSIINRLQFLGAKFTTTQQSSKKDLFGKTNYSNLGPRLGFAYRPFDGSKSFVVRGGYRISYFQLPLRSWTSIIGISIPFTTRFLNNPNDQSKAPDGLPNYAVRSVPTLISGLNTANAVSFDDASGIGRGSASINLRYFKPDQPTPRVQDWNFTLEKEVAPNTLARVAYVGNHGSNQELYYRYNEATPDYIWFKTTGLPAPTGEFANSARRFYDQQYLGDIYEYQQSGFSNYNGMQFELERRYSKGMAFQVFYNINNALGAGGRQGNWAEEPYLRETNQFLPTVPQDLEARNRFLNYRRDLTVPKHRVRWNWIVDLPFGKGKRFAGNAGGFLNRVVGGWQVAGTGSLWTNYFSLPTNIYPTGAPIEVYGDKYPIQDCRGGACRPGYLWWNGYIPANQINSVDASGKPNGVMGVPDSYKPAGEPLNPWPKNPDRNNPNFAFYGTNTVFVPLKNGTLQRTIYDDGLHPWRNQPLPSTRQWSVNASLFKAIPITEKVSLRFNADFSNVLNMPGNPTGVGADGILSTYFSGVSARELQLTLRLSF